MVRHLQLVTQNPTWQAETADAVYRDRRVELVRGNPAARAAFLSQLFLRSRRVAPDGYPMGQRGRVTQYNNEIELTARDDDPNARRI